MRTKAVSESQPTFSGILRLVLAALLVFTFAFICNAQLLRDVLRHRPPSPGGDEIGLLEQRFAKLRSHLPASGVVGLVVDPRSEGAKTGRTFFVAQYALAPLVVVQRSDCEWVVVDCAEDGSMPPWDGQADATPVAGAPNGATLFHRPTMAQPPPAHNRASRGR